MANVKDRTRPSISCRSSLMLHLVCWLLLLTFRGDASTSEISAQRGKSIILFQKVDPVREITVYKNGETNFTIIVTLKIDNEIITPFWGKNYTKFRKISVDFDQASNLDIIGSYPKSLKIWIEDFDDSYVGTYCLQLQDRNSTRCTKVNSVMQGSVESDHCIVNIISPIIAALAIGILALAVIITLIHKNKTIQDWLWKRVFKTYLGKLTVEQVGMDIQEWLNNHPDFNYNPGKLTEKPDGMELRNRGVTGQTGELDDHSVQQSELEEVKSVPGILDIRTDQSYRSAMEESEERESDLLLPTRQAADQSSGTQQHELHIPPPVNLLRRSNLAPDSNEGSSSEA